MLCNGMLQLSRLFDTNNHSSLIPDSKGTGCVRLEMLLMLQM